MITKKIAATLWANDYKLRDEEGKVYTIDCVANDGITLTRDGIDYYLSADAKQIGTDYKILCRPLDLTKEIKGIGVPIVELAKIIWPDMLAKDVSSKRNEVITNFQSGLYKESLYKTLGYDNGSFIFNVLDKEFKILGHFTVPNQEALFSWLDKHHFLRGVEEDCLIYITE